MEFLKFDADKCILCGICVEKCPFGALAIEGKGIVVAMPVVCADFVFVTARKRQSGLSRGRNPLTRINGKTFLFMWSRREVRSIRLPLS